MGWARCNRLWDGWDLWDALGFGALSLMGHWVSFLCGRYLGRSLAGGIIGSLCRLSLTGDTHEQSNGKPRVVL